MGGEGDLCFRPSETRTRIRLHARKGTSLRGEKAKQLEGPRERGLKRKKGAIPTEARRGRTALTRPLPEKKLYYLSHTTREKG